MARSFRFKAMVAVAGLVALALGGFAVRAQIIGRLTTPVQAAVAERPAQPVRVVRVAFTTPETLHGFTGTVRPQHETAMAFRVPGKIVARLVEVGDKVASGQVLARMDDTDARLSLEAAEAEVAAAQTDMTRAAAASDRSRGLFASGFAAKAALDNAISTEAQAQGRLDRAIRVRDQSANALYYTVMMADASGVVTGVSAETGEVVSAGQPVTTIARTDALDVVFALPEQMREVLKGAKASASLWGDEGRAYALTLRDISPDVDPATRTYRVRMAIAAPDATVALGRTMTVTLAADAGIPVAALPLAAVMDDGQGAVVWRVTTQGTGVQRVPVKIAALTDGVAKVSGGLADGDLVVSLGTQKIDPSRPVRVVETDAQPAM